MKNFIFKSKTDSDLLKILLKLEVIQKEQRHARYDLQLGLKTLDTIKKGIAILVTVPEPSLESEQDIDTEGV